MPSERLTALDAFRGLTIAFMVLVNDAGDGRHVYAPLQHAEWNGWTPTDVVFPSFLFIVGVALVLSLAKRETAGVPRAALFRQAARRALILYVLGLIVYAAPQFNPATQRLLGVLQRIAICYLAAAAICLTTGLKGRIVWLIGLLTAYWLLMTLVPVPGFGPGHLDVEGNFAHYIDRIVLGAHNYRSTKTWDPEGIVSTLPAIGTALLGVLCGQLLQLKQSLTKKVQWMLIAGVILVIAGEICNVWMPINKKLWTPSFTLFMAGLDFLMLSTFIWLMDILGFKRPVKPLVIMGLNPIAIYMLAELLDEVLGYTGLHRVIYKAIFQPIASPINASLLWALAYTALMYLAASLLYRNNRIVKI
jgi:predicted acyltransferase